MFALCATMRNLASRFKRKMAVLRKDLDTFLISSLNSKIVQKFQSCAIKYKHDLAEKNSGKPQEYDSTIQTVLNLAKKTRIQ